MMKSATKSAFMKMDKKQDKKFMAQVSPKQAEHTAKMETHKQMMQHHKSKMDQHMAKLRAMKGK